MIDLRSYPSEHPTGSWKNHMLDELKNDLDLSRIHFTGLLTYGELVQLFRRSNLHCYFTRPYVVSWGIFQAAACGASIGKCFEGIVKCLMKLLIYLNPVDLDDQLAINQSIKWPYGLYSITKSILAPGLDHDQSLTSWSELIKG